MKILNRSNSLNALINKNQDLIFSKINKIKKIHIIKKEEENAKLPNINNDKILIYKNELTSLNNNNETTNSSNNRKNNIGNKIFIPVLKSSNRKIGIQTNSKTTSTRKIKIKNFKLMSHIKKSASTEVIIPLSVPNISDFHNKLMEQNRISCKKRLKEDYLNIKNNNNEKIEKILYPNRGNIKAKTGIYGPTDNIVSVIRARVERLKLDNEYRGVDEELKELIKDEIMDAQVRLKIKPVELFKKKGDKKPLYLKKLDRYRYLSKTNLIREINQVSETPLLVKDGNLMIKLINDAFDNFKTNKKLKIL